VTSRRLFVSGALAGLALALAACQPEMQSAPLPEKLPPLSRTMLETYAHGFAVGAPSAVTTVYVFYDAQCPYCAALWRASQPLLGEARFVWIPVAMLTRASLPQGATILGATAPALAMSEHEALFSARRGGITVDRQAQPRFAPLVLANTEIARRLGLGSVPVMYVSRPGRALVPHAGALPTAELRSLLGLTG
jgi:thiol:disulfide interchange protein DsbG